MKNNKNDIIVHMDSTGVHIKPTPRSVTLLGRLSLLYFPPLAPAHTRTGKANRESAMQYTPTVVHPFV